MNAALGVATRLRRHRGVALLHSARQDNGCGRWSFVACEPVRSIEAHGRVISLYDRSGMVRERFDGDPLEVLQELVQEHTRRWSDDIAGPVPVAIGYIGYDLARVLQPFEAGSARVADDEPDMWFGLYDSVWRFDEHSRRSDIVGKSAGARRSLAEAIARGDDSTGRAPAFDPLLGQGAHSSSNADDERTEYVQRVERALSHIRTGEVQHLDLTRRLVAEIRENGDPMALYAALMRTDPAPYSAFLSTQLGEQSNPSFILSASPVRFLTREPKGELIESRPFAGMRPRTGDAERDREIAAEMAADPKGRALLQAIVDATSGGLGQIASPGTVTADEMSVQERPHEYHLASRVAGELQPNITFPQIIRTMLPWAASAGVPLVRALELIDALEPTRRRLHHGTIGYLGLGGAMDLAFSTKTALLSQGQLTVNVSDCITADTDAAASLAETERQANAWRKMWNLA